MFLVDRRAYTCRISDALPHLHVCSTRRADYFAYSSPSLASANWRIFAPCKESDSRMAFISKARRIERAANAVCSFPMSIQPEILIFVLAPPPWREVGYLAHAEAKPLHVVFS